MTRAATSGGDVAGTHREKAYLRVMEAGTRIARLLGAALGALALAGCGEDPAAFRVRDAAVVVRSDAPFTQREDFPGRVESTVAAALRYWGGDWSDLAGARIVFEGDPRVACGGIAGAVGCYDGEVRVSTQDAGATVPCVEATVLVHEIGHAVIGDAGHADPRWMDFESLADELAGRPGYGGSGPEICALAPSVWRHPPGH